MASIKEKPSSQPTEPSSQPPVGPSLSSSITAAQRKARMKRKKRQREDRRKKMRIAIIQGAVNLKERKLEKNKSKSVSNDDTETDIDSSDAPLTQGIGVQDFVEQEGDSDEEFSVDYILAQKVIGGELCFKLKWTNYDLDDTRWYPRADVGQQLVDAWWDRYPKLKTVRLGSKDVRIYHVSEPVLESEEKKKKVADKHAGHRLCSIKQHGQTVKIWIKESLIPAVWLTAISSPAPSSQSTPLSGEASTKHPAPPPPTKPAETTPPDPETDYAEALASTYGIEIDVPTFMTFVRSQPCASAFFLRYRLTSTTIMELHDMWGPLLASGTQIDDMWLHADHMWLAACILYHKYGGVPPQTTHTPASSWEPADLKAHGVRRSFQFHFTGASHWVLSVTNRMATHNRVYFCNTLSPHYNDKVLQEMKTRWSVAQVQYKLKPKRQTDFWQCGYLSIAIAAMWMAGKSLTHIRQWSVSSSALRSKVTTMLATLEVPDW